MSTKINVRLKWVKLMYGYTILGAGGLGLLITFIPNYLQSIVNLIIPPLASQDPQMSGWVGSVLIAFGSLSILALRSPVRFLPVLMLQLVYKTVWIFCVYIPIVVSGNNTIVTTILAVVFLTYIIGDLIAIPFSYLLSKEAD